MLPKEDYRQWLRHLLRFSFFFMRDVTSFKQVLLDTEEQVYDSDSMLAWATEVKFKASVPPIP